MIPFVVYSRNLHFTGECEKIKVSFINLPDQIRFQGSILCIDEERQLYACFYHSGYNWDLCSCIVQLVSDTFIAINDTRNHLGIYKYGDPRPFAFKDKKYVLLSTVGHHPIKMHVFEFYIKDNKIYLENRTPCTFHTINNYPNYNTHWDERNWTPWIFEDKFYITHSIKPHIILEFDVLNKNVTVVSNLDWTVPDCFWSKTDLNFADPKLRLNCPPVKISDNTFLSVLHTCQLPNRIYWHGFYIFENIPPFKIVSISSEPFVYPALENNQNDFKHFDYDKNPLYPFTINLLGDDKIVLCGGSNESEVGYCFLSLQKILNSMIQIK